MTRTISLNLKSNSSSSKLKYKSATPINLGLSAKQHADLKKGPRTALTRVVEGKATSQDWYTLTFRTMATKLIAEVNYTEETVKELQEVCEVCLSLKERMINEDKLYLTPDEIKLMTMGLDAADVVQMDNTRRVQLDAYKKADDYTRNVAKQINERIAAKAASAVETV